MTSAYRSRSGRFVRWDKLLVDARRRPGVYLLAFRNEPAELVRTIRLRRHRDLITDDGHLEAKVENKYTRDNGALYGDVFVRWIPDKETR